MADSEQSIGWTAVRQVALECLDATWDMVWWAERSQEDDYDVDGAALHLAAIDKAGDALTRAISMFEPGLFDSLAKASVSEGPRPDFQVGDICLPTAHEMAFILLRHAIFWVENGLAAQGINPIEQLHELSAKALHEMLRNLTAIKSLSLLTPQQFKVIGRSLHLGTLKPIESLLTIGQCNMVRAWIDREWAAVSQSPPKRNQGGTGNDLERPSKEALALAVLADHPGWSDTEIAKKAGCNRTTLYAFKKFMAAKEILREEKNNLPRGSKFPDEGMEAWDNEDEE
jgi:hypothetical protein